MTSTTGKSPLVGGAGGRPYSFNCPQGSYITNIAGRSARWFDGARFICSDGTTSPWYGGMGGDPWDESSDAGFIGWSSARGDNYVDQLTMRRKDGSVGTPRGGSGGNPVAWAGCPSGSLITGASGSAQTYLDGVSFICGAVSPPKTPSIYDTGTVYTAPPSSPVYNPASPISSPAPTPYNQPTTQTPTQASIQPTTQSPTQPTTYVPTQTPQKTSSNTWILLGFLFFVITAVIIALMMSDSAPEPAPVYKMYYQPQYAAPEYQPQYAEPYPPRYAAPEYQPQYAAPYQPQ